MTGIGGGVHSPKPASISEPQVAAAESSIEEILAQLGLTAGRYAPYIGMGTAAMPQVQQGNTAQGMDARLSEIFGSNAFGSLQDQRMRAVQNQLNQSGMRRSDAGLQAVANVPTELGLSLEDALYKRQSNALGLGYNASADLSGLESNVVANIANLRAGQGAAIAQERVANRQAAAAESQNDTNTMMTVLGMAAMFFSDPRLKTNVVKIGSLGRLGLYSWDWIDGVPEWVGRMKTGFLTTEVKAHYPQHVYNVHGFDAVDYASLTDELRAA